jgi:hypothetical protein
VISRRCATEAFPKSGRLSNASSNVSRTVLYPRWESNFTGWCLVRKLWRRLKLAHFAFAFSPISTAAGSPEAFPHRLNLSL